MIPGAYGAAMRDTVTGMQFGRADGDDRAALLHEARSPARSGGRTADEESRKNVAIPKIYVDFRGASWH